MFCYRYLSESPKIVSRLSRCPEPPGISSFSSSSSTTYLMTHFYYSENLLPTSTCRNLKDVIALTSRQLSFLVFKTVSKFHINVRREERGKVCHVTRTSHEHIRSLYFEKYLKYCSTTYTHTHKYTVEVLIFVLFTFHESRELRRIRLKKFGTRLIITTREG